MVPDDKKSDSWRRTLKLISHCPVCGQSYKPKASHLFINENEARFIHFTCGHCQSNFMVMVMVMAKGMSTVGIVTDLSLKDIQKLYRLPPITVDEMLEGRQIFNSRDFNKLLLV